MTCYECVNVMPECFRQMILCPERADFSMAPTELVAVLNQLDLIGARIETGIETTIDNNPGGQRYLVGEHFLQHVSFMGCAPAVEFAPPDDGPNNTHSDVAAQDQFTFIYLPELFNEPVWQADLKMAKAGCPACNKRTPCSDEYLDMAKGLFTCPHCQQQSSVCDIDWREFGGCAKTMISIVNVYPKEAIPSGNLISQLSKLTNVAWRYFYINGSLPKAD